MPARRLLAFTLLLCAPLCAQDIFNEKILLDRADQASHPPGDLAGGWKGTVETNGVFIPFYLVLRRDGAVFTATAGPTAEQQIPLPEVVVQGSKVRFPLGRSGAAELTLSNGHLIGGVPAAPPPPASPPPAQPPAPPPPQPSSQPPPQPQPAKPPAAGPRTAKDLEPAIARLDAMAAAEFSRQKLASVTIGVVAGPDLVWTKSYGLADIEANTPATRDSVYRVGSITKQFTALMLLQLVEQGKVRFSDAAAKYVPEISAVKPLAEGAPPPTLLQLATHTSGLATEPDDSATYSKGPVAKWEETALASIPMLKFVHEPGARYLYSNIGYALLGLALSRAARQPYTQYVAEHILQPLGMAHSGFDPDAAVREHLAKGYVLHEGKAFMGEALAELEGGRGYRIPNGGLFTTVGDLARFVSFEMGDGPEAVLPRKTLAENFSRTSSAAGDLSTGYGCGFRVQRRGDFVAHGHSGSVQGYTASAFFHAPSHVGLIVLRSATGPGFATDFLMRALEALVR